MTCSLNLREQLLFSRKGLIPKYVLGVTVFGVTQKKRYTIDHFCYPKDKLFISFIFGEKSGVIIKLKYVIVENKC